tara:strand:+ start:189 stop:515 length:327 start_codon:yes stop_codon:yes gene_type:complete
MCDVHKKTIPELKNILRSFGLKVSGSKPELISRIKSFKPKPRASIKRGLKSGLVPDPKDPYFMFYASSFYQCPNKPSYVSHMKRYGLSPNFLHKFSNHKQLFKHLNST